MYVRDIDSQEATVHTTLSYAYREHKKRPVAHESNFCEDQARRFLIDRYTYDSINTTSLLSLFTPVYRTCVNEPAVAPVPTHSPACPAGTLGKAIKLFASFGLTCCRLGTRHNIIDYFFIAFFIRRVIPTHIWSPPPRARATRSYRSDETRNVR